MPFTPTQNPYGAIGAMLGPGLDAIVASPTIITIDALVAAVSTYIETTFYPSPNSQLKIEISSIAYHAINSYNNNLVLSGEAMYNRAQAPFIQMLIGGNAANIQPDTIQDWIADVQDNVGISELNINEQIPLFLATTLGTNAAIYWANQVNGEAPTWGSYLAINGYENYINSLLWDKAAMNGALAGYGATPAGLIEPTTNMVSTNMISALIGALTVTAGKVIFGWIPRIVKPLQLNMERIANLNNVYSNNFANAPLFTDGVTCPCGSGNPVACTIDGTILTVGNGMPCTQK